MKHQYALDGLGYRLRPICMSDAQFIIDVRLEDIERNRFIHPISNDISLQEKWLRQYFERDGDYYFVVENRVSGQKEGLISFYDENNGKAEYGRWVMKKNSLAAIESILLLYRIAFEQAGLSELYCRTILDNTTVVSLHNSIGEKTRRILNGIFELNGNTYDAVEHYSDKTYFYQKIAPELERHANIIFKRNMRNAVGNFDFHHIGVATQSIDKELPNFILMGYSKENTVFEDMEQGVRGLFLTAKHQPRLELLENLPGSHTLDKFLSTGHKCVFYHMAYMVNDIEAAVKVFFNNRAKVISKMKISTYFRKRICFMVLSNMDMIELIEI